MQDTPRLIGGRYQILREIAAGGMGTVYEAKHNLSQKSVALKVLHPHVARDDASRQRFLREVSAPAQIGHPGICDVYDAGFDTEDGSVFIAMELLRGQTLREALEAGTPRLDELYVVFDQLLDALAAAHAKGIVHRDLKPENVFLTAGALGGAGVKLMDFGIVTDGAEAGANVTQAGTAMGTPRYMSPEQATNARDVSAASDVWAVGVMLYEALVGTVPFDGPSPTAVVVQVITTAHRPLESLRSSVPAPLVALVDRCLSKKPEDRPRDAGALRAELQRVRADGAGRTPSPAAVRTPPTRAFSDTTGPMGPGGPHRGEALGWTAPASTDGAPPARGATAPSSPHARTPPSFAAAAPRATGAETGGGLKWVLMAGGVVLGLFGLAALGLGVAFVSGAFTDDTGQVRIQSNIVSGEIFVDGASRGPLTVGRILELPVGPRQMQARVAGAVVAEAAVQVEGGALVDVDLSSREQRIPGTLGPGDDRTQDGKYADRFSFTWRVGQNVHLEANSQSLDTYLYVRFPDGSVHENDDATGTNAGLEFIVSQEGAYEVMVSTYRPGDSGPYDLFVRAL